MPVFVARGVRHLTETNLECYFLAGIIVEIKTEGVKTLFSKSIEAAGPGVRIDGQSHRYCSGYSAKEINVAEVDSGDPPERLVYQNGETYQALLGWKKIVF